MVFVQLSLIFYKFHYTEELPPLDIKVMISFGKTAYRGWPEVQTCVGKSRLGNPKAVSWFVVVGLN